MFKTNYFTLIFVTLFSASLFSAEPDTKKYRPQLEVTFDYRQTKATKKDNDLFMSTLGDKGFLYDLASGNTLANKDTLAVRAFLEENGKRKLVGMATYCEKTNLFDPCKKKFLYINSLCVSDEYQKKGIGSQIFNNLYEKYRPKRILLSAEPDAVAFWEKLGFLKKEANNPDLMEKDFN